MPTARFVKPNLDGIDPTMSAVDVADEIADRVHAANPNTDPDDDGALAAFVESVTDSWIATVGLQ